MYVLLHTRFTCLIPKLLLCSHCCIKYWWSLAMTERTSWGVNNVSSIPSVSIIQLSSSECAAFPLKNAAIVPHCHTSWMTITLVLQTTIAVLCFNTHYFNLLREWWLMFGKKCHCIWEVWMCCVSLQASSCFYAFLKFSLDLGRCAY